MKSAPHISDELAGTIVGSLPGVDRSVLQIEKPARSRQTHGFNGEPLFKAVGSWRSSPVFRSGVIYGLWTLLGFLNTSQMYLGMKYEQMNHSYFRILFWQLAGCWLPWAVVTLPIVWMGRRFPIEKLTWKRTIPIHIGAIAVLAVVHTIWFVLLSQLLRPFDSMTQEKTFSQFFWGRLSGELHLEIIVYGMIIGLSYAFDYHSKFREREFRASQLESQLAQAQLQALKMQLHPHFLFNTLNGIAGLVRTNNNKVAVSMIAGLSELLRHALENAGKHEVPLREELEFLELYLELQQMRFSDRLNIRFDVSPDTLDASVPNLILQPIVENAIRHGIALKTTAGLVGISADRCNGFLELKVYDDGPGLKSDCNEQRAGGIGLSNTRARLSQLYGDDNYTFQLHNREPHGAEAIIKLPFTVSAVE